MSPRDTHPIAQSIPQAAAYETRHTGPARIYLDYAATTPLRPVAWEAMKQAFLLAGNPASIHGAGRATRTLLESCRRDIGGILSAQPAEVVFTSGGTESNFLALHALKPHVTHTLLGGGEHDSLRRQQVPHTLLPLTPQEAVCLDALEAHLKILPAPVLCSIQWANHETGACNDIPALGDLVHRYGGYLHSDATQALGKIPVSFQGVDLLTVSALMVGGPVGVGALCVRDTLPFTPPSLGGGQERGLRPGTSPLGLIAGFAAALQEAEQTRCAEHARLWALLTHLESAIQKRLPQGPLLSLAAPRLPSISCIAMPGIEAATQVMAFDLQGLAVSAGAACSSGKVGPSATLRAMGLPFDITNTSIRVSMGWMTSQDDVNTFIESWTTLYTRLIEVL